MVYRGKLVENRHRVSLAVHGREGLLAYAGNPALVGYLRSSAKPFQALALFLTGAVERFGLTEEEVALATASHDGTPRHVEVAARFLAKLGLGPEHLVCGVHPPFPGSPEGAGGTGAPPHPFAPQLFGQARWDVGGGPGPGGHRGYEHPDHPVQALNRKTLAELSGAEPLHATDGCSVPNRGWF